MSFRHWVLCLACLPVMGQGFWVLKEVKAEPISTTPDAQIHYNCRMDKKGATFSASGKINDLDYDGPFEAAFEYGWELPENAKAGATIAVKAWVNKKALSPTFRTGASLILTAGYEGTMATCVAGPKTYEDTAARNRFESSGTITFPSSGGEPYSIYLEARFNVMGRAGAVGKLVYRYEWKGKLEPKKPEAPPPPECSWPPEQKLNEILRRYYQDIPKGRCYNGMINNVKRILDPSLKMFTCGGYQDQVLNFLDKLRRSKNPAEQCLLKDFDYGPIEIGIGLHQAVVIYRKGEDWKWKGVVLDPWFNQKPEVYTIAAWQFKSCVSMGSAGGCTVNGASWLGNYTQYPTVGGPYPGDEVPQRPKKAGHVTVNCPLAPFLTDAQGRVSGYRGGRVLNQIPGVTFMSVTLQDGTPWTEFEFTPAAGLKLGLESLGDGKAVVVVNTSGAPWQYRMDVKKQDAFAAPIGAARSPMSGPRGPIPATAFTAQDADGLSPRLQFASSAPSAPPATKMYRHVGGAFHVSISTEWTVREHVPQAGFDMLIRTPDRDNCAVYFGRDHDNVSKKGMQADLDEILARLTKGRPGSRPEWLQIASERCLLIPVYDSESNAMLWHFCLGHRGRIYYIDIESLPKTGRRELPQRIREMILGLVFEAP